MIDSLLVPLWDIERADATGRRRAFAQKAKAEGTWAVYEGHWQRFVAFAIEERVPPGPPTDPGLVADYIIRMRDRGAAASTIKVALAAIAHRSRLVGAESPSDHPQVAEVLAGAVRLAARDGAGRGACDPLMPDDIRSFIIVLKDGLVGQRDMAILTFGFAGGFRREELSRLRVEDLKFERSGILVTLPWSKTDQTGKGHTRRIATGDNLELCPVLSVETWLAASGIRSGPLFRPVMKEFVQERALSPRRIDQIIREYARRLMKVRPGALTGKRYSAHSLRAGLCTAAALAGKPEHQIRDHVGHRSAQTTARYIRMAKVAQSTVTKGIGL